MIRFSANLGFLWADLRLPEAIRRAKAAGFDAVECHWPYGEPAGEVRAALEETGLPMISLNTRRGDPAAGENGLAALPGREDEAQASIAEAMSYAESIGAGAVHVMAGQASGQGAAETFARNLQAAARAAERRGVMLLIEPLNPHDAPGYFLRSTAQARGIIERIGSPSLRLMFDCYHVARSEGDIVTRFRELMPVIGHVQFASPPGRGAPGHGEIDYGFVFRAIEEAGWDRPLGAEYRPGCETERTLGWMREFR